MTNAVGYYRHEREEAMSTEAKARSAHASFDINRDFPYNTARSEDCLNTIAGRVVYQIFAKNNILASLTFHGGTNVIGYPWGSYNHASFNVQKKTYKSDIAPDHNLLESFAFKMQEKAGATITYHHEKPGYFIKPYVVGDMTTTVYPVHGGLEDWGYGAGWDTEGTAHSCKPQSYRLEESIDLSAEAQKHIAAAVYLIETDDEKKPDEKTLGKRLVSGKMSWPDQKVSGIWNYRSSDQLNGHINRNIRLIYALLELVDPFIEVVSTRQLSTGELKVFWQLTGCAHYINRAFTKDH